MESKIKSFTDLIAWQQGHKLALKIYKLTIEFPDHEKFGLTNQIRRASVSITSNLAEGFSRKGNKEKVQFYYTSLSSLTETQNQLLLARDLGYLGKDNFLDLANETIAVSKLINGLIKGVSRLHRVRP